MPRYRIHPVSARGISASAAHDSSLPVPPLPQLVCKREDKKDALLSSQHSQCPDAPASHIRSFRTYQKLSAANSSHRLSV